MPIVREPPYLPFLDGASGEFRWRLGLRPLDLDDWFDDGPDAADWIAEKQRILAEHFDTVFVAIEGSEEEAGEVADAVVAHLRRRGDAGARLDPTLHPLDAAARLVAEDLVLLVERDGDLVVGAGSVCFPNRWDLRSKLGRSMREVHAPVPLLDDQLGDPVDRFLARLEPTRSYWRLGWGIIDVPDGYTPVDGTGPPRTADVRPEGLFLRVERETLRRFPRSGAVLFTIRTYVAPLAVVAADAEVAQRLATAVESMPVPVRVYKDLAVVGDELVDHLRSSGGISDRS